MNIGLIDVDNIKKVKFPNLALMKISAYHKQKGDNVSWYNKDDQYNIVYVSKVFSDTYSPDIEPITNAKAVIKGGTGYAIKTVNGKEIFDNNKHRNLPKIIDKCFPDYSIYPTIDFAVSMTSRGCPRGCSFCHVAAKEGKCAVKVADVCDFYAGQKNIKILDPNITALPPNDKYNLYQQYIDTKARLDFTQGIDIRLITDTDIEYINKMRLRTLHFAWDNPHDKLESKFANFALKFRRKSNIGMVYCLTNYNSTMKENLYRIYTLRDMGFDPYVMIYDKPNAPKEIKHLQRWCNNKIIFKSCKRFEDYKQ